MATTIYCDDAGFTGDRLLDGDQPYFGYSAVALEPDDAAALVARLRARYGLVGAELKGRQIYRRPDAEEIISWLLGELGDRASVVVNDKLFSLACKFFEYVYEPVLARNSKFFYDRDFHLHVATIIWGQLRFGDGTAGQIAARFEAMLRRQPGSDVHIFEDFGPQPGSAMEAINRFIEACRPEIEAEVAGLADETGRIRWTLDLSLSSAMSVLRTMGDRFGQLDVVFDESKPLESYRHFFDSMVGRTEIARMDFRGRSHALVFNLARPVTFGQSAQIPGLQIADIIASFSALASRDRFTDRGRAILAACLPWFNDDSIWPEIDQLRIERKPNFLNTVLLMELTERAEAGMDLLAGLPAFYDYMADRFDRSPPPFAVPSS